MKLGVSYTNWHREPDKLLEFIEKTGIKYWEVVLDKGNMSREMEVVEDLVSSMNLNLTFHAPFSDINPASLIREVREKSIETIKKAIEVSSMFSDVIVAHPGNLKQRGFSFPEKAWELNVKAFREIGRHAEDHGVRVYVENMPEMKHTMCKTFEELEGLIYASETECGMVFDVGHANTTGCIRKFLSRLNLISHIHLHDNDGKKDLHKPLGEGCVDWEEVLPEIRKMSHVICVMEIKNFADGFKTIDFLRNYGIRM